ncbi:MULTISPECIES: helix-turn-helix domain-containing protein [unclassified Janthinobacterium]|uniref:AraC family transcriptional regulator n=1 Tax=unclassified Janthinobacterium TaxID=2610881 RepID=UPI001611D615|nr:MULTISPECIES: helix-turn-helix transcriptional regulator [unclassified Janthinobacterium]MBB5608134.1 AraC-like DNA-binding protein [Janthinobacterium sp. S3T4]MBB5613460.1 AraC-like DNA-binding protein [Janthinobacterium sp. S3M3]
MTDVPFTAIFPERRDLPTSIEDIDDVLRPVLAVGVASVSREWEHIPHRHRKGQLLYAVRGIIHCEVESGVWIVPPQCAVWIPGGLLHTARGVGEAQCYCLFVEAEMVAMGAMGVILPGSCCTLAVSPLLRELIIKAAGFPTLYALHGAEARLVATLLDELAAAPVEDLHLPLPRDVRLRQLASLLLAQPADKSTLTQWAARIGMSERSMTRQLLEEIGMSVGRWRRQLHVIITLQRLAKGHSVKTVALELGYENTSGFVTMFRKATGKPPARYLAERKATTSA